MKRKAKGIGAERQLVHMFWNAGWAAVRIAASGATKNPSADVLCGNAIRKLAIECKTIADTKKYIPQQDMKQFLEFAKLFGAEPWIAIKFNDRKGFYFINPEDMRQTEASHSITLADAQNKALSFEELIK